MRKFRFYLKTDLKRLLCSPRPAVSVLLTVAVLFFAVFEGIDLHAGVLYVFSLVMYGMPAMMIFVCAAIAFADSFCEDMEHKYVMQQVIRGNAGAYVLARMLTVFLAAMFSAAAGIFLFANILHFRLAWVEEAGMEQYNNLLGMGTLKGFLENRRFELYFICYGLQYGFLAGILSLWASWLSLYISNRMLVLAAPMILYYFADYLLAGLFPGVLNLGLIFSPSSNLLSDGLSAVVLVAAVTIAHFGLLWLLMSRRIRGKIYG